MAMVFVGLLMEHLRRVDLVSHMVCRIIQANHLKTVRLILLWILAMVPST